MFSLIVSEKQPRGWLKAFPQFTRIGKFSSALPPPTDKIPIPAYTKFSFLNYIWIKPTLKSAPDYVTIWKFPKLEGKEGKKIWVRGCKEINWISHPIAGFDLVNAKCHNLWQVVNKCLEIQNCNLPDYFIKYDKPH